jgi:hypothetical protein
MYIEVDIERGVNYSKKEYWGDRSGLSLVDLVDGWKS